jgi:hypothetical protein
MWVAHAQVLDCSLCPTRANNLDSHMKSPPAHLSARDQHRLWQIAANLSGGSGLRRTWHAPHWGKAAHAGKTQPGDGHRQLHICSLAVLLHLTCAWDLASLLCCFAALPNRLSLIKVWPTKRLAVKQNLQNTKHAWLIYVTPSVHRGCPFFWSLQQGLKMLDGSAITVKLCSCKAVYQNCHVW